ncbi:MAG: sensor histidine kinase N-terminal domain-containing protein [Caldimonas sp.]
MSTTATTAPTATRHTLRSRLLWRILLALAITWSIGSGTAFSLSWVLAGRAFDRALLDDAKDIAGGVSRRDGALTLSLTPREINSVLSDAEEKEFFAVHDATGRMLAGNADIAASNAIDLDRTGFADGRVAEVPVRIVVLHLTAPTTYTVLMAQTLHTRQALLRGLLVRSLLPQLVLLIVLGVYLRRLINRELQPLGDLQRELDRRHSSDLDPVAVTPISSDVEKLRNAVNSLLARVGQGVQAQREFSGNVAHDLRTPLAGIRALAEYGLARPEPEVWREQLKRILQSEEKASHLVDQLLALALADEARDSVKLEPVRVDEVVRRVLLSFVARADALQVDLGADGIDQPVTAEASPVLLEGLLANLIDNALRYGRGVAPAAVTVEVERRDDAVLIAVTDNGPGLDSGQRERMKQRWTQGLAGVKLGAGAGLGLAIASRYAELMGGSLRLDAGTGGLGVRAVVRLGPAQPPDDTP